MVHVCMYVCMYVAEDWADQVHEIMCVKVFFGIIDGMLDLKMVLVLG